MNLWRVANDPRKLAVLVLAHFVLLGVHAAAHSMLGVVLSDFQSVFVVTTMIILPIIAAILLFTRRRAGLWLLLVSMLSSFIFGLVNHVILPGVDNVFTVPAGDWRPVFQVTTFLLGVVEATGILFPALGLLKFKIMKIPSKPSL